MNKRLLLGVNIDHVATIRQARRIKYPDPVQAAIEVEQAGADAVTLHLREDRRHISDRDVYLIRQVIQTRMNLELAITSEMLEIAEKIKPHCVCFVPEKREEITTEGGLNVLHYMESIKKSCQKMQQQDTEVSLFIDPDIQQIDAVLETGASTIELHTGAYAQNSSSHIRQKCFNQLEKAAQYALTKGLIVNAGHGLDYHNVESIASINGLNELNIGHSIIGRALFVGLKKAVKEMKSLIYRNLLKS